MCSVLLEEYLNTVKDPEHKKRMTEVFEWVEENYPVLEGVIKWKQAMFTDHGTFIIGFSETKNHMSFTPEEAVIQLFSEEIVKSGYEHTKGIVKIKWTDEIDFALLKKMIEFNLREKAECTTFFRK